MTSFNFVEQYENRIFDLMDFKNQILYVAVSVELGRMRLLNFTYFLISEPSRNY